MSVNGATPNNVLSRNSLSPSPPSSLLDSSDNSSSDTDMSDPESDISDNASIPTDFPFEVLECVSRNVFPRVVPNNTLPIAG